MGWSLWTKSGSGEAASKSVSASQSRSGYPETHHISTAGGGKHHPGGGDRDNHTHVVVQHKEGGKKSAHAVPHKHNR